MPTDADFGTPPRSGTPTNRPPLTRSTSSLSGIASRGVERVGENWSEGLVLLGTHTAPS